MRPLRVGDQGHPDGEGGQAPQGHEAISSRALAGFNLQEQGCAQPVRCGGPPSRCLGLFAEASGEDEREVVELRLLGWHRQIGLQFCEDSQRPAHAGFPRQIRPTSWFKSSRIRKSHTAFSSSEERISTTLHPPFIERVTAWRSQTLGARALIGGCRGAKQQGRRSHAACMEEQEWQVGKNNTIVVLQNSEPIEKAHPPHPGAGG